MSAEIYNEIYRIENLLFSWQKIKQKGSAGGIDSVSVETFEKNLDTELKTLSCLLSTQRYIPEPYKEIKIPKDGYEYRSLSLPTIRDKIVQQTVKDALEPTFEKKFLNVSYGYRPSKGPLKAVKRVFHLISNEKREWVTLCDIDNYFDNIHHTILFSLLTEIIKDSGILSLIRMWLRMGKVDIRLRWRDTFKGIPQGAVISPLLSNLYLHPFDNMMVEKQFGYLRYADDFVILSRSEEESYRALRDTQWFLRKKLKLFLNPGSQVKNVYEGFEFLGILFKGSKIGLKHEKIAEIKEKISDAIDKRGERSLKKLQETIQGIGGYYGLLLPQDILEELDEWTIDSLKKSLKKDYQNGVFSRKEEIKNTLSDISFLSQKYQLFKTNQRFACNCRTTIVKKRTLNNILAFCRRERRSEKLPIQPYKKDVIKKKKREYQKLEAEGFELIISKPGIFVGKTKRGISIKERGNKLYDVPLINLKHITILSSGVTISSNVIYFCAEKNIPIDFVKFNGRPYAKIYPSEFPSASLGIAQLKALKNGKAAILARTFVSGKIRNQINLTKYYHKYRKYRDKDFVEIFEDRINRMESLAREAVRLAEEDLEIMRGKLFSIEGRASICYWELVERALNDYIDFEGRIRKGAEDLVNSLLNYGYGILYSRIWEALLLSSLNPYISYLHKPQTGKPTLIFDLIEEFRQQAVDRPVFSLITKGEDLRIEKGFLADATKKRVVEKILERINTVETFRGKDLRLTDIIKRQVKAVASFIEGKTKHYRPYISKW